MAQLTNNIWNRMARRNTRPLLSVAVLATLLSSCCINDNMDDCPSQVSLKFDYTYNVKEADAFSAEVKNLNVYVFDKNGKYYDTYVESASKFESGHTMNINNLPTEGKYTFVCLARNTEFVNTRTDDDEMEFSFTQLTPGVSTMDDLQEEMGKKNSQEELINNKNFTALYTAKTSVDYKEGKSTQGELSLMKCTKTYRIVLMPYGNAQDDFTLDNFDVRIAGSAALLDCNGDKVENKSITYLPYSSKTVTNSSGETEIEGEAVDKALVYDLASSRMFERDDDTISSRSGSEYNDKRIIITDKRNGKVLFDHSLPWFLAMCGEHTQSDQASAWGDQEYLDRQDHYVLTFYVPKVGNEYHIMARVKVNGWVLNLINTDIQ